MFLHYGFNPFGCSCVGTVSARDGQSGHKDGRERLGHATVTVDVIQKHVGKKGQQQPERHLGRIVCCEDGGF